MAQPGSDSKLDSFNAMSAGNALEAAADVLLKKVRALDGRLSARAGAALRHNIAYVRATLDEILEALGEG